MPIVQDVDAGVWKLQCINGHRDTMCKVDEYTALPVVVSTVYGPMTITHAVKVDCYYCSVCRYTEFYMPSKDAKLPEQPHADPTAK